MLLQPHRLYDSLEVSNYYFTIVCKIPKGNYNYFLIFVAATGATGTP